MRIKLTTKFVESVKPGPKRQNISDLVTPNLILYVQVSGKKSWAWQGRMDGKFKVVTLGGFPEHDLASAREWASDVTANRDLGVNIVAFRANEVAAEEVANSRTCDWLFKLYMDNEGADRKSAGEKQRMYDNDIKPQIGSRVVDGIEHDDLAKIIRDKARTAPIMSNALQSLIRRWFKWSVSVGRDLTGMKVNPALDLVKLAVPQSANRYLDDEEIGFFFQMLASCTTPMNQIAEFVLHTGARRMEAIALPWSELDLEKGVWILPAARSKNKMEHLVPLPVEMITMLKERREQAAKRAIYVWPGSVAGNPINGLSKPVVTMNATMAKIASAKGRKMEGWSMHDLRRTLSTGMNSLHDSEDRPLVQADIVERVINHKLGGVSGIYNRYGYMAEKKAALRVWADHLAGIKKAALASMR